jgi:hypothetical protein
MADSIGVILTGDNSQFKSMVDSSSALVGKFNQAFSLIGVGIGANAVLGYFKNIIDKGGALQDLSDRLHVGTDALQAFDYHVRLAGGTSEQAVATWDKARKALDNLALGNEAVTKQFDAIGLSAKSFIGLNLEQALSVIAKGYAENSAEAGAYDAITDILGARSAPALNAVLLQLGSESLPAMIEKTREAGQLIASETIPRLDEFGDNVEMLKGRMTSLGATVMGWVFSFADILGQAAGNMVNAWEGLDIVPLEQSAIKAEAAIKKVLPAIADVSAHDEKILTIREKQNAAMDRSLTAQEKVAKLSAEVFDLMDKSQSVSLTEAERRAAKVKMEEKIADTLVAQNEVKKEQAKIDEARAALLDKEVQRQIELLPLDQQRTEFLAQISTLEGGIADAKEKGLETIEMEKDLAVARGELRKVEAGQVKESLEMAKLLLIPADKLTDSEKLRLQVLQGVVTQKQLDDEKTQLLAGLVAGTLTEAEKNRLRVLMDQAAVLGGQLETAKAITATVNRTGKGYDAQSDDSLEGVRRRLEADTQRLERERFGQRGGVGKIGGAGPSSEEYLLNSELFNLNKELKERQTVRDWASRFGEAGARQKFGDTLTDKALRDWSDDQKGARIALEDIQQRLEDSGIFPKKR